MEYPFMATAISVGFYTMWVAIMALAACQGGHTTTRHSLMLPGWSPTCMRVHSPIPSATQPLTPLTNGHQLRQQLDVNQERQEACREHGHDGGVAGGAARGVHAGLSGGAGTVNGYFVHVVQG